MNDIVIKKAPLKITNNNSKKEQISVTAYLKDIVVGNSTIDRYINDITSHVGEIGIDVNNKFRNRGVGSQLLQEVINNAKKKLDIKIVKLCVYSSNKRAINFYKKHGFTKYGNLPDSVNKDGIIDGLTFMYKEL